MWSAGRCRCGRRFILVVMTRQQKLTSVNRQPIGTEHDLKKESREAVLGSKWTAQGRI